MLAYIFQKTLWKYKETNDEFNKLLINLILNKNKNSIFFSSYQTNIIDFYHSYTFINKLYNLYQSIKLILKITESDSKNKIAIHPFLLNKYFHKLYLQNLENQNIIIVKRKSKLKKNDNKNIDMNDLKLDNSLSSIKKTIDLDEKDIIQKGCLDFATGNDMIVLLNNFQKMNNENLYNNYYNNCNIYKKKKSPQASFHVFSPKNRFIFRENEYSESIKKNKMINNNIFINNNNYNSHTNYIFNEFKNLKELDNLNNYNNYDCDENNNLNIEKRFNLFSSFKSQTKDNLISNRFSCRNRFSVPLSQSCEKFIYTKKNIPSKIKKIKLVNKTSEGIEKNDLNKRNELDLNNIMVKYIPFNNKHNNIKIIENNDKSDDIKIVKIEKVNYIGRNKKNKNDSKKKYPSLLSRITKNIQSNRRPHLTQDFCPTKFNSTFSLNYLTNCKEKQIPIVQPKKIKNQSNYINIYNIVEKNEKLEKNIPLVLNNKKEKKQVKRKENNVKKIKKNNTANYNFKNINKKVRQNLFNTENQKKSKNKSKKKQKEQKFLKSKNLTNANRFNSPEIIRDCIGHMTSAEHFTNNNKNKRTSYQELLPQKTAVDFLNLAKSNVNENSNTNSKFLSKVTKNHTAKMKKKALLNSKSIGSISTISKQLFSPLKLENLKINKNSKNKKEIKTQILSNENLIFNSNCNDNIINCFNTLPGGSTILNNNNDLKNQTISPSKNENDNLILNRISSRGKKKEIPIKVNLNAKCFNESYQNKNCINKPKKCANNCQSFDIVKSLYSSNKKFDKNKKNLKKNTFNYNKMKLNN